MKTAAILWLLLLFPVAVYSQEIAPSDGNWWLKEIPDPIKIAYLMGISQGVNLGYEFHLEVLNALESDPAKAQAKNDLYYGRMKELRGISMGQMRDGFDEFYKDYRNRRIKLYVAYYLVAQIINGTPNMDKVIEDARRQAAQ